MDADAASSMSLLIVLTFIYGLISSSKADQMVPAMFIFGDSLVDVGNNNFLPVSFAKANYPHYGVDFPSRKATGRFSNGKNSADLLAKILGLPTSPPYLSLSFKNSSAFLTGVSFASAGAGIFNGSDQVLGQSIPFTKQVANYELVYQHLVQTLGSSRTQKRMSKSLLFIVIGSNDVFDYYESADLQKRNTPQQYVDLMILTFKGLVKRLHSSGARKFVIPGIGAIGCVPLQRVKKPAEECNEELNSMAVAYNERLKSILKEVKIELKDVSYTYFDTYAISQNIVQNPTSYGFSEVKAACCGLGKLKAKVPCLPLSTYCPNRRDHFWWDLVHPTEATDTILMDAIFNGPSRYTFPMNVRRLIRV